MHCLISRGNRKLNTGSPWRRTSSAIVLESFGEFAVLRQCVTQHLEIFVPIKQIISFVAIRIPILVYGEMDVRDNPSSTRYLHLLQIGLNSNPNRHSRDKLG